MSGIFGAFLSNTPQPFLKTGNLTSVSNDDDEPSLVAQYLPALLIS